MSLLAAILGVLQVSAPTRPQVPGTYFVLFCASACARPDSAEALARGLLVLDSVPLGSESWFGPRPNGCFEFRLSRQLHSYAALFPSGYTAWERVSSTDSILFDTYRSPDAGHIVRATLTDSGLVGFGHSSGAGVAEIHVPDEYVVGWRLGPPDMDRCPVVRADRRDSWLSPLLFGVGGLVMLLAMLRGSR